MGNRAFISAATLVYLTLSATGPVTAQVAPTDWRAIAARDLQAMHDGIANNSPITVVTRDSRHAREWLEAGLVQGRSRLPRVTDAASAYFLLAGYAGGFRDSHIALSTTDSFPWKELRTEWPGIATAWQGTSYVVSYADPASRQQLPPIGARLVSCDGISAERLARRRADLFDGNLNLAGRTTSAARLLWKRGNPFAGPVPRTCTFSVNRRTAHFRMTYRPISDEDRAKAVQSALPAVAEPLGLSRREGGTWWVSIPSFGKGDWAGFFGSVGSATEEMRRATTIVIDVRGNGGGNSAHGLRLAELLWGEEVVKARYPRLGPVTYRVSSVNRLTYVNAAAKFEQAGETEGAAALRQLVARFDQAITEKLDTFVEADETATTSSRHPVSAPLQAKVVLLTDYACNSACLDMIDLFTAMPNVLQAGSETGGDTIFMDISRLSLPSGMFTLGYGHKAWTKRPRGSNVTYRPSPQWTYPGDPRDNSALQRWVARKLKTQLRGVSALGRKRTIAPITVALAATATATWRGTGRR